MLAVSTACFLRCEMPLSAGVPGMEGPFGAQSCPGAGWLTHPQGVHVTETPRSCSSAGAGVQRGKGWRLPRATHTLPCQSPPWREKSCSR